MAIYPGAICCLFETVPNQTERRDPFFVLAQYHYGQQNGNGDSGIATA
jgi:hypothetical protein